MRRKFIIALNLYFILEAGYFLLGEFIRSRQLHEIAPICEDGGINVVVINRKLLILFCPDGKPDLFSVAP